MHKIAMTGLALVAFAAPALAEDWDFVLINGTGKPIKSVEVSAAGAATWVANRVDEDRQKEGPLKAGGKMTVHFDKGAGCKYDVKVNFSDDSSATWSGFNVCDYSYMTLSYAGGNPTFKSM